MITRVSRLSIYLEWLDEVRHMLARHGDASLDAWAGDVAGRDLRHELRAIASDIRDLADELDQIGDGVGHLLSRTHTQAGGRRPSPRPEPEAVEVCQPSKRQRCKGCSSWQPPAEPTDQLDLMGGAS